MSFVRHAAQTAPAIADSARAADLIELLEDEGPGLRFLKAFAEAPRQARRLTVRWLALGWPGANPPPGAGEAGERQ
jgi:hypothetical protein